MRLSATLNPTARMVWRQWLLVLLLVLGQWLAGAHAVEHAAGKDDALPTHVCQLCLAAHDLGAALPAVACALPVALPPWRPLAESVAGRHTLPALPPSQRGPPYF